MARKNVVKAFKMISDADMSANIISSPTNVINLDKASIKLDWSSTGISGTVVIQAVQTDKELTNVEESEWFDLNFGSTITISADNENHQLLLNELPFTAIRIKYISTAGIGTLQAKISAKQIGG